MRHAEREKYRLHGNLPVHRRRLESAKQRVAEAINAHAGLWAVCVSGGKDSVVLASIASLAGWVGPLFHFRHAETPPENTALCHLLADRFGCDLHVTDVPGAFDVFAEAGFFVHAETDAQKSAARKMLSGYKSAAAESALESGHVGQFWGLRAEESRERSITLAKKGWLYRVQDRSTWTCCPIGNWSARDVWAHLINHDLPWLDRYDRLDDRERGRSEITWLAAEGIWRYGQGQALRRSDPALWAEMIRRYPDLSRWG